MFQNYDNLMRGFQDFRKFWKRLQLVIYLCNLVHFRVLIHNK